MSRGFAVVTAAVMLWSAAAAAFPAIAQSAGPSPAPPVHPGTRLSFAPTIGSAKLEQSAFYTAVPGVRDATYTYVYSTGKLQIIVNVYDAGRRAPSGSASPALAAQFESSLQRAEQELKTAGFSRFERQAVASICPYGTEAFRCIVYSAVSGTTRLYSKLLMTGFRDNFLKIRIDWSQAAGLTQADADKALSEFVPTLVH